jgi:hypothetical protein
MSAKPKFRLIFLLPVLVVLVVVLAKPTLGLYDSLRLARFAHRIADTDRIVTTFARSSVSLTITGDDAKKVVRAVSSASSDRPPFGMASSCSFMARATFFRGTNVLDDIEICSSLFLIHETEPPFRDDSKLLDTAVYQPIAAAFEKEQEAKYQSPNPALEPTPAAP